MMKPCVLEFFLLKREREEREGRERKIFGWNYVKDKFWSRRRKCHAADHFCDWTKTEIAFEIVLVLSFLYWDQTYCSRWNWSDCLVSCFCLFLILWNQAWHWFGIWHVFNCLCIAHDRYLTWNTGPTIKFDSFRMPLPKNFISYIVSYNIFL